MLYLLKGRAPGVVSGFGTVVMVSSPEAPLNTPVPPTMDWTEGVDCEQGGAV